MEKIQSKSPFASWNCLDNCSMDCSPLSNRLHEKYAVTFGSRQDAIGFHRNRDTIVRLQESISSCSLSIPVIYASTRSIGRFSSCYMLWTVARVMENDVPYFKTAAYSWSYAALRPHLLALQNVYYVVRLMYLHWKIFIQPKDYSGKFWMSHKYLGYRGILAH